MENAMNLTPDETRIADNYNREYPQMSREQAVAKAKQVLADIAGRGKELPPVFVPKPVKREVEARKPPKPVSRARPDTTDAFRDGMMEALNGVGEA